MGETIRVRGDGLHTVIYRDTLTTGEVVHVAMCQHRAGCMAHGATPDEAVRNLDESRALWDARAALDAGEADHAR